MIVKIILRLFYWHCWCCKRAKFEDQRIDRSYGTAQICFIELERILKIDLLQCSIQNA